MNWWAAVVYDGCDARVSVGGKSAPTSWPVYSCTAFQPLVSSRGSSPANRGHTPNAGSGSGALVQTCWRCSMRPPHINSWKPLPQSFRGDCFHPLKSWPPELFRCKKVSHQVSSHLNLIIINPLKLCHLSFSCLHRFQTFTLFLEALLSVIVSIIFVWNETSGPLKSIISAPECIHAT